MNHISHNNLLVLFFILTVLNLFFNKIVDT
nr:MAG TPA: hypothetical protein [Caudoviricetes sp.]